jgi:hypothetical protein
MTDYFRRVVTVFYWLGTVLMIVVPLYAVSNYSPTICTTGDGTPCTDFSVLYLALACVSCCAGYGLVLVTSVVLSLLPKGDHDGT